MTLDVSRPINQLWAQVVLAIILLAAGVPVAASAGMPEVPEIIDLPVNAVTGSAEPNLTRGPEGTLVLSWQEPQGDHTLLRFSRLDDTGWSGPQTVAAGDNWFVNWADFPSVLAISERFWAAHWLQKVPGGTYAYHVNIALSQDAGESWGPAITPHRDDTPAEHGFVSLFPSEQGVGAIWLDGRNTVPAAPGHGHDEAHGGGMTLRSAVILPGGEITAETELDALVCDCCQTSVAMARQGPVAVYRNRTQDEVRDIYITRFVDGEWLAGQAVHTDGWKVDGCPVNGPAVAAHGDTVAVAWFTMADEIPRVRFARSEDGGASFAAAVEISANSPLGRVGLVLLDNGTAVVGWLDQLPGGSGEFRLRSIVGDGKPAGPLSVTRMQTGRPSGFPQMQSDGNELIVAWTEGSDTDGGKSGSLVKSARIIWPAGLPRPD